MFYILIFMIAAHIIDDYYMQGVLAKLKQTDFWAEYDKKYRFDYIPALIFHSFSWAFSILAPVLFLSFIYTSKTISIEIYSVLLLSNMVIHAIVDDLKANKKRINLCVDQSIHIIQIVCTWLICYVII